MWCVGQKGRCVNDRFPKSVLEWGSNLPQKGEVYTIRHIRSVPCAFSGLISPAFLLEELPNPFDRLHFDPDRFVPINPDGCRAWNSSAGQHGSMTNRKQDYTKIL